MEGSVSVRKLINFLKFAAFVTILGLSGTVLFFQEWGADRDEIPKALHTAGLTLPLDDARIEISTAKHTLTLMAGDVVVKRYDIALGRNIQSGVIWKGAGSTPLGEFKIVEKVRRENVLQRGSRFLRIDFPRVEDLELAWERSRIGDEELDRLIDMVERGQPLGELEALETEIGIQGNWFHVRGFNVAADGSVSLRNSDINELYEYVDVGTPVLIRP
jgi:L,D-transpeptidase-like protein